MKQFIALAIIPMLAGCVTNGGIPDQTREISVLTDARPAGAVLSPRIGGLVAQTSPSYVTLTVHEAHRQTGAHGSDIMPEALTSGSGFIVHNGYVLTAGHVAVSKGFDVDALDQNSKLHRGKVVAISRSPDMALIKLRNFSGPKVTPVSNPCLKSGSPVYSLGKPHAMGDTARIGDVESMSFGRPVTYNGFGYPDAMVLKMNTRKGESGGPVFSNNGRLAGMVVSTLSDGQGRSLHLAHAIPTPMLAKFICKNLNCSSSWKALVKTTTKSCKN